MPHHWLILLALITPVAAQTVTGTLEGHVTDASGAAVASAKITAKGVDTGLTRSTRTNETGYYQLTFLPIGDYTITAEGQGFGTLQRPAQVELNAARTADFKMKVATVSTEVTVEAATSQLETSSGAVSSSIDQKSIEDRPLSSRNILSLLEMVPGFQSSGSYSGVNNPTLSSGSYASFNGTGSRSAAFQVDGVNNDDSSEGTNRQNVNVSAIKEFQVLTNAFSAEFGRAAGAVILVQTKSGTNQFHGDAYEYLQNQVLNSNGFFNNSAGSKADGTPVVPRAPYRRNQFGYTVGGPVIRNKLFFFHSFERTELRQYNTVTRWVFLPNERIQIGTCKTCLDPAQHPRIEQDRQFLQGILDRFPKELPNNLAFCDHCLTETTRANYPDQDYSGKMDYNATSRDMFTVRYQYSRQRRQPFSLIQGEAAFQNNRQQSLGGTHTHIFSPNTTGEFRFGLGLRTTLVDIYAGNDTPIVRISNPTPYTTTTMGSAGQYPIHRYQTDYQYNYNLSHVRGRHILRAGIDFRRQHLDDLADNYSRGYWTFASTGVRGQASFYEGYENFLRGYTTDFQKGYGNFTTFNRLSEFNQYIQDDWKLLPALTLNLGLRYEVVQSPSERDGKIAYNYPTFGGLEPRFGFAWLPKHLAGVSIRGGFGIYHSRIFQSIFTQGGASLRSLPPYGVYRDIGASFNVGDPDAGFVYNPASYNPGRISTVKVAPDLGMPSSQQMNLTVEKVLPSKILLSVGFNRTRGIGLLQNASLNRARFPILSPQDGILYNKIDPDLGDTNPPPGYISLAQPRTNQRRPDTRYTSILYINNGSWSYYNALRVAVTKRYSRGLHWTVNYSFSKSIDTGSDVTSGNTITEFGSAASNRGLSDFDQRHRINLNYGYSLPWFNKGRGLTRQALGGWTISGNHTYASGNPFTVTAGYDYNGDGVSNDRPILLNPSLYGASIDNGRTNPATGKQYSVEQFPVTAFYPNVNTTTANRAFDPGGSGKDSIGRNTFFGAGIKNWDLRLAKTFAIRERHKLAFQADMFNVTNSVRFGLPSNSAQSTSFGRITSTYDPLNFVGASRGAGDTSRTMQMGLHYTF